MKLVTSSNILCIIITYNPELVILQNLSRFIDIYDNIYIVDNGSTNNFNTHFDKKFKYEKKIKSIYLNKNYGIAKALNIGIDYGKKNNFEWINTFDQDSIPIKNIITCYNIALSKIETDIFVLGVNYTTNKLIKNDEIITITNSTSLITSGCLYPTKLFDKVGLFNENLFIDGVDFDFNLRTSNNNYKTIKIVNPLITHEIGTNIKKNILGYTISSSNHNIIRRYYMGRNHVYLTLKYFLTNPLWVIKKNIYFIIVIMQILMVEKNKIKKFNSMFKGFFQGFVFYLQENKKFL